MSALIPRTLIIDDFLPAEVHAALLAHTLATEAAFKPSAIAIGDHEELLEQSRIALKSTIGLGPLHQTLDAIAREAFPKLCEATGVPLFDIFSIEYELAAHCDGAFYLRHLDSKSGNERDNDRSDRILTAVYYFHHEPKGFSGGNLAIYPFIGKDSCQEIEPHNNRVAAFASIVPHEVRPVSCPSGKFEDYRYALNIWYRRAK